MKRQYERFLLFLLVGLASGSVSLFAVNGPVAADETSMSELHVLASGYTLEMMKAQMLKDSTDLRKLREEVTQSLLDVKDARAGYSPTIDLQVSGTYMFNPPVGPITVSSDDLANAMGLPANPAGGYITLYEGMENTLYQFSLSLTQPLITWGKIGNSVKLYQEVSEVRQLQLTSQQSQLQTELETRLASLWYLDRIRILLAEQRGYAARLVELARQGEANGMLLRQDVLEAQIQAKQLDITLEEVGEQFDNLLLGVQKLTGLPDLTWDQISFTPDEAAYLEMMGRDYDLLEVQALSPMQDSLRMLDKLQRVSLYAQDIAEASVYWKPDFALKVDVGYAGSRFPLIETDWYRKDSYSANITIGMKTTVWDGGKKLNDIKRAKSSVESAVVDKDAAMATIRQTLREQWRAMQLAQSKIEYQDLKISVAQSKISQQQKLYDSGYGDESALLQAKVEDCTARIELEQQKLALANAYYMVKYLASNPSGL